MERWWKAGLACAFLTAVLVFVSGLAMPGKAERCEEARCLHQVDKGDKFTIQGMTFDSKRQFVVQLGRRCAIKSPSVAQRANLRAQTREFLEKNKDSLTAAGKITIPVKFHVLHNGNDGKVKEEVLDKQLAVLNQAYNSHDFEFTKAGSATYTDNATWFNMGFKSAAERQAKTKLQADPTTHLNFYTANLSGGLLGWATFPWELEGDPHLDGVVVLYSSLPGGSAPSFNLGMTAVHEVGHWVGLFHTFGDFCDDPADEVEDTPPHLVNDGTPNPMTTDTCPSKPGLDPVHNYMNYTDDVWMKEFTGGQITRARAQVAQFRLGLFPESTKAKFKK